MGIEKVQRPSVRFLIVEIYIIILTLTQKYNITED